MFVFPRNLCLLSLFAIVSTAFPAYAQLTEKMRELQQTKQQIESSRAKSAQISGNIEKMEREMNSLGTEITEVAGQIQGYGEELGTLEERLADVERQRTQRREELAEHKRHIGAMLSTLVRLGQIPKESALLMPANFMDKVRATRALGMTTHGLRMEMDSVKLQLVELKRLEKEVASRRAVIESKTIALRKRQEQLRRVITQRKRIMETLYGENQKQQEAIAALIGRSEDLQALVNTLEGERQKQLDEQFSQIGLPQPKPVPPGGEQARHVASTGEKVRAAPPSATLALPSIRDAKGRLRMPTGGKVIAGYGQQRGVNDTLKGVEIATRPGAQVIAPFDGEVLFTGPFRDYGNMVILRHSDNYHTLLAGLTELDCVTGQRVRSGEPVGLMGDTIEARRLYLEMRHAGKPTDPKPWIAGFSSYLAKN